MRNAETARKALREAADVATPEGLMDLTFEVARQLAKEEVDTYFELLAEHLDDKAKAALTMAADLLSVGPDDDWSGRGNDLRRVIFDAKRQAIRSLVTRYSRDD